MITADEGRELLQLVKEGHSPLSDAYGRMVELAERVAHDALVYSLSEELELLVRDMDADPSAERMADIRRVAEELAELAPPEQ